MRAFIAVAKALAEEGRVRILLALRGRELCVCEITRLLRLAPSTVSKHMSILRQADLVVGRKEGRWVYYRLPGDEATPEARSALTWIEQSLSTDETAVADIAEVEEIVKGRVCACDTEPRGRVLGTRPGTQRKVPASRSDAAS
jgi:DNA-binding transcriptional ArsR family regulator